MGDKQTTTRESRRSCAVDDCDRKHKARGFCTLHYDRWKRLGSAELPNPVDSALRRFDGLYVPTIEGCWRWTGTIRRDGYGQLGAGGRLYLAHKWRFEQEHGPVPDGLELDHLCRNKWCVRPSHLEPVSHRENILRRFKLTADEHRFFRGQRLEAAGQSERAA